MTGTNMQLQQVAEQLYTGNVGKAIAEMETYLAAYPQQQTTEKLKGIKTEYQLMEDYWRKGVVDPQLTQLYQHLLQRLYVLFGNVASYYHTLSHPTLSGIYSRVRMEHQDWSLKMIRKEMEDFVSSVAMLEFETEQAREVKKELLYRNHQLQMNALFNYILTSRMWSDGVGHDFEEMLISPTIDGNDQQLLVSAVTLSLLNQFDMAKFRTLVNVYRRSQEEAVRQRALVGWVLAMDDNVDNIYPEQAEIVAQLLKSEKACEELTELQMQLIYCLNAEKDTKTIQKEIMPDLMANQQFQVTQFGIVEREEDPMEDILHPEASEQRMEKLEATFGRMMDMQKQGSDIYFGGFSQMKRFPFFYDISNWFTPFFFEHPDIIHFVKRAKGNKFLEKMMRVGPFCDSDKYSFVIAFQQVMEQIPESMRKMLDRGEATMGEVPMEELTTPAYMRRAYLMDLYRFFRLYPNRQEFENPFAVSSSSLGRCEFFSKYMFIHSPLEAYKDQIVRLLIRQKLQEPANILLDTYDEDHRSVQYYIWREEYDKALELEPGNERAMRGKARQLFDMGIYDEAEEVYDELLLLHPDDATYLLYKAICQIRMREFDKAPKLLYRLNYENPDDDKVNRVLAWTHLCCHQLEQADKIYQRLTSVDKVYPEDWQNAAYCLWFSGKIDKAIDYFRKYIDAGGEEVRKRFCFDLMLLERYNISQPQVKMMEAAVLS